MNTSILLLNAMITTYQKSYDLLKKQPSILSGLSVKTIGEKTVIK